MSSPCWTRSATAGFLAGCSPRIGAGWQQKLLDLDIPVSGQFLLEVWFPTWTRLELAAEVAGLADGCACCSWRLERRRQFPCAAEIFGNRPWVRLFFDFM